MSGSPPLAGSLPPLVDSHCHLTWESFAGEEEAVVGRMRDAGVAQAVVVATTPEDARDARSLASRHAGLFPTAGLHPNDLPPDEEEALGRLETLLEEGGFVAVGEAGLDYYRDRVDPRRQQRVFRAQIDLALRHDLPLIVHVRDREGRWDAFEDVGREIGRHPRLRGVIHCFTGTRELLGPYLEAGFCVSSSGVVTFPRSEAIQEAARAVPASRLLVETDAPFLAPAPVRGRRNEPAFVVHTARRLAALRGEEERALRAATTAASRALFRLPEPAPQSTANPRGSGDGS